MNEQNPYQAPYPVDETSKPTDLIPQTFRQVLRQGVKLGFKWGNRIGLVFCSIGIIFGIGDFLYQVSLNSSTDYVLDSLQPSKLLWHVCMMMFIYCYMCILCLVISLVVCALVYGVRKTVRWTKRRRKVYE